ncbi:hypothetical protein HGG75_05015 [Ochrobactrum pseudogrignonense]|nr:hypothetical protein [Brucella pseudogrignonensis]
MACFSGGPVLVVQLDQLSDQIGIAQNLVELERLKLIDRIFIRAIMATTATADAFDLCRDTNAVASKFAVLGGIAFDRSCDEIKARVLRGWTDAATISSTSISEATTVWSLTGPTVLPVPSLVAVAGEVLVVVASPDGPPFWPVLPGVFSRGPPTGSAAGTFLVSSVGFAAFAMFLLRCFRAFQRGLETLLRNPPARYGGSAFQFFSIGYSMSVRGTGSGRRTSMLLDLARMETSVGRSIATKARSEAGCRLMS